MIVARSLPSSCRLLARSWSIQSAGTVTVRKLVSSTRRTPIAGSPVVVGPGTVVADPAAWSAVAARGRRRTVAAATVVLVTAGAGTVVAVGVVDDAGWDAGHVAEAVTLNVSSTTSSAC